jgi:hypothetical protein
MSQQRRAHLTNWQGIVLMERDHPSNRRLSDVAGKLDLAPRDLCEQRLKNIGLPVCAFAIDETTARPTASATSRPPIRRWGFRSSFRRSPTCRAIRSRKYFADGSNWP